MRLYNIIYQKLRFAGFLLLCLLIPLTGSSQVQKEKKTRQSVDVTIKVTDESGTAVPRAKVVVGEGVIHAETDENGSVTFKAFPQDIVTVSAPAYEKKVSVVTDLIQNSEMKLVKSKLYMTSDDDVALPFTTLKRRHITGPETTVLASRLEKYPSNDLRNSFTGLTSGWDVRELYGWPGISAQENLGSFGATDKFSNMPVAIVDGIPCDLTEMSLDASEIESITINKGILASAMFGPVTAKSGFIFIKTKRGVANEKILNVSVESGVSTIDRMPGWVSGADYADLNNKARTNSELTELYTPAAITEYAKNDAYNKYYPSINFKDMMLKNNMGFRRANISSSGGNDIVRYYSYIGYNGEGDIYKMGATSDYNKISTRQNVDVKVNDFLSVEFSFYGNLSIRRSPNYDYDSDFTSENSDSNPALGLMEMPAVLGHINSIPPIMFPVLANYDSISKVPWYGVASNYTQNPIGNLSSQGYYSEVGRLGASSLALNFDMGKLVKGLRSTTFFGFNLYNLVRSGQAEDYMAYIATPSVSGSTGNDTILLTKSSSHNLVNQTTQAKLMDYYFQRYSFYENLQFDRQFGNSQVQSNFTYYLGKTFKNGIEEPERQQNAVWHTMYSYNDKYSFEFVLNYSGTYSFDKDKRYRMFPSGGASWVISEEGFMANIKPINYLKIRAQGGLLGVETFLSPFYYMDRWNNNTSGSQFGASANLQWFGTSTDANVPRIYAQRIGNPDLSWETIKELNLGFDALLFDRKLSLSMTYTNTFDDGVIVQVANTLPYTSGLTAGRPYYNYTQVRGQSLMTDLMYTQKAGDFEFSIGGNATTGINKREKYDEPNYRYGYQTRVGKPDDAIFGFKYIGKFATDAETLVTPQLFDAELKAGDLKYADLNEDGFIDDNDQMQIGHSSPRLFYGITGSVRYKNFEFFIHGAGRAFFDIALTNSYFWNGWGENNYSNFVKENVDGAYPRLTYYKVNNNFLTSNYWLTKGDYFKIQNVEIAYTIPPKMLQFIGSRGVRVYLRGANLMTFTKVKDVDPENISAGVSNYPLFRTFSGGVKFNF